MRSVKKLLSLCFILMALDTEVCAERCPKFVDTPLANRALERGDEAVTEAVAAAHNAGSSAAGVGLAAEKAATKGLGFCADLGRNIRAAAIRTGTTAAICGGKVGRNLASQMATAAIAAVAAQVAHEIGACYKNGFGDMPWLVHKLCHFVLGGTTAELTGGDFLSGAAGATVGEIVCEHLQQDLLERTFRQAEALGLNDDERLDLYLRNIEHCEQFGRLVAAGTAFVGHMDTVVADEAAQTAIEENSIPHLIAGGALLGYVAYDYFQTLTNEGWDGLLRQVREEYAESISCGPNPVAITGAFVTLKLRCATAKFLATRWGHFLEAKLVRPGTKAFDDFVNFLVSHTPTLQHAGEARVASGEASALFREVQESSALFNKKLAEHAKKGGSGAARKAMDIGEMKKLLKSKVADGVLEKTSEQYRKQGTAMYRVKKDTGCLREGVYIRLDAAHGRNSMVNTHAHFEVRRNPKAKDPDFECYYENGQFVRSDK